MKSIIIALFIYIALQANVLGAPMVRPVMGGRHDGVLPAATDWGDSFVATRESQVDFEFQSGVTGKGFLYTIFDRTTGFYVWMVNWRRDELPESLRSRYDGSHVVVTPDSILVVGDGPGADLSMLFSIEKAESMDDAEAKVLRWAAWHLNDIEHWTKWYKRAEVPFIGIYSMNWGVNPIGIPAELKLWYYPRKILGMARREGHLELTVDGYLSRPKGADPNAHTPQKAMIEMNGKVPDIGIGRLTCLDDNLERMVCPDPPIRTVQVKGKLGAPR